ncbi:hypothetical protein Sjap_015552 [Stephania japonica]|uniref:Uncharacterized protein n=1 Tax=Stephania japonica TaxID=461633 RepID=A0AAP0NSY4_9MAGN
MGLRDFVLFLLLTQIRLVLSENVDVTVKSVTNIATTDDTVVCATIDWWPPEKCNYGMCPWGKAGLFNLDLNNKILRNAVKAFNPMRLRFGGSLEDQIVYQVGRAVKSCPRMKNSTDGLFGFTKGCLTMSRWDEINEFTSDTGAVVTFGLNALIGRTKSSDNITYVGNWHHHNARDLIKYTVQKGYNIESWELGNELCGGGVSAKVDAAQYGKDTIVLRNMVDKIYKNSTQKPKVLGPGGFYDEKWFDTYLQVSGASVVDSITHHIYNLGPGVDPNLIYKIQDPFFLDQIEQTFKDVANLLRAFPWASAWIGESGGAHTTAEEEMYHMLLLMASGTWISSVWHLSTITRSTADRP